MASDTDLFRNMSNEDIAQAVLEEREWARSGILPDGVIREKTGEYLNLFKIDTPGALRLVSQKIIEMAAYKWVEFYYQSSASSPRRTT